jgi:hypothetical protein
MERSTRMKIDILRHKIKVSYDVRFSKKVKWIAVDSDGEINGYSEKPHLKNVKLCGGIASRNFKRRWGSTKSVL